MQQSDHARSEAAIWASLNTSRISTGNSSVSIVPVFSAVVRHEFPKIVQNKTRSLTMLRRSSHLWIWRDYGSFILGEPEKVCSVREGNFNVSTIQLLEFGFLEMRKNDHLACGLGA